MMKKLMRKISQYLPNSIGGKLAVIVLSIWILTAIFSPFIANNVPILAKTDQGWTIPVFSRSNSIAQVDYTYTLKPIIKYRYDDLNLGTSLKPPFSQGENGIHFLGTDMLGRDIAAGIVHGARVALVISSSAIILSLIFGMFIGLIIGYYGDNGFKRNIIQQFLLLIIVFIFWYYAIDLTRTGFSIYTLTPLLLTIGIAVGIDRLTARIPIKKYGLPLDIMVQRLFEIKESIPGIFIILACLAIFLKPSILTIPVILAILFWMTFARHVRAETLHIKEEEYIKAAKSSGMKDVRILLRHILPNAMPSLLVVIAFSFSGVILLESTLSFLGIGLPLEEISWGKILAEARNYPKSWWLAVFPGLAIFLVLYAFNTLGDILSNYQRHNEVI